MVLAYQKSVKGYSVPNSRLVKLKRSLKGTLPVSISNMQPHRFSIV